MRNKKIFTEKQCKICNKILDVIYFDKNRRKCKKCINILKQIYYKNNINKKPKPRNKEQKEKQAIYSKEYRTKNNEYLREKAKIYRAEHKDEIRIKKNEIEKERRKTDPEYRIKRNISALIRFHLKSRQSTKDNKSSKQYLPFTFLELKIHIENLFSHPDNLTPDGKAWMTWKNQGIYKINEWDENDPLTWRWQLDHIIPHSTFKYTSMKDQSFKDCWALSNLAPLNAKQNMLEGSTRVRHKPLEEVK